VGLQWSWGGLLAATLDGPGVGLGLGVDWVARSWAARSWAERAWDPDDLAARSWAELAWEARSWAARSWARPRLHGPELGVPALDGRHLGGQVPGGSGGPCRPSR
jgi:hypothetical protein